MALPNGSISCSLTYGRSMVNPFVNCRCLAALAMSLATVGPVGAAESPNGSPCDTGRQVAPVVSRPAGAMGPLVVSRTNSRYFADPQGRVVFLAGSHTWNDLVDMDATYPPRAFDFDRYLSFLQQNGHNLTRIWAWETPRPADTSRYAGRIVAAPQPWLRTGPGLDVTGLPRFDLTKLDPQYFDRLRSRVRAARAHGIYVIVMLFEGWSAQFSPGRGSHPFLPSNNVNGLDDIADPRDIYTLKFPRVTELQEIYVQRVIDSLADLDNVLFEVANEAGAYSTEWQYEMIRYVKCSEARQGVRHPVGMTYQYQGGTNEKLFQSEADWISPGWDTGHYLTAPEPASGKKVIIADTDHLGGSGFSDERWAWRSLFRGLNLLYMDTYVGQDSVAREPASVTAALLRSAIGEIRAVANFVGIDRFTPSVDLASTGFALEANDAILVLATTNDTFTVNLTRRAGTLEAEWLDYQDGKVLQATPVEAGASVAFESPFPAGSVLYLRAAGLPSLTTVSPDLGRIRANALRYAAPSLLAKWYIRTGVQYVARSTRMALIVLAGTLAAGVAIGFGLSSLARRNRRRTNRGPP
jgi:hypothetical protein